MLRVLPVPSRSLKQDTCSKKRNSQLGHFCNYLCFVCYNWYSWLENRRRRVCCMRLLISSGLHGLLPSVTGKRAHEFQLFDCYVLQFKRRLQSPRGLKFVSPRAFPSFLWSASVGTKSVFDRQRACKEGTCTNKRTLFIEGLETLMRVLGITCGRALMYLLFPILGTL